MSSNEFKDYYAILGVKKMADSDEIKQKFRKLALKYHPDRNQGNKAAEAKFKEISEAYDVLYDRDKRARYDRFGKYWQQSGSTEYSTKNTSNRTSNPKSDFNSADFSQYGNFEEFINELLGRFSTPGDSSAYSKPNPQNYSTKTSNKTSFQDFSGFEQNSTSVNSEANISLTYAEAFQGTIKRLSIGAETLEVRIPAGAKPGSRIRIAGKGQASYGQSRGDLYLNIQLNPHAFFYFEGDDLACEVPIAPDEAVLGSSISIPTPDGRVNMKIPAGISSGQVLRLRGKGWSSPKEERSDQLVKIVIATPQQISSAEKEYYEKIRALRANPRQSLQNINL